MFRFDGVRMFSFGSWRIFRVDLLMSKGEISMFSWVDFLLACLYVFTSVLLTLGELTWNLMGVGIYSLDWLFVYLCPLIYVGLSRSADGCSWFSVLEMESRVNCEGEGGWCTLMVLAIEDGSSLNWCACILSSLRLRLCLLCFITKTLIIIFINGSK